MIKEGFIENIINKKLDFDKETIKLAKQYLVLDVISDIKDGMFQDFGVIRECKFNSSLIDENVLFDVESSCSYMGFKYTVLKKEEGFYIVDVEDGLDDFFGVKMIGNIAYVYENAVYINDYIYDKDFQKEVESYGFNIANTAHYNFNKDIYKSIVALYDDVKSKPFFIDKVVNNISKDELLGLNKPKSRIIKNFISFFSNDDGIFTLNSIDASMYYNVFKGKNKDRILNLILNEIHCGSYEEYTKNICRYKNEGEKYINSFIEKNKDQIIEMLSSQEAIACMEKNIIEESYDILKSFECLNECNKEINNLYCSIKKRIEEIGCKKISISFDGEIFTNISGAFRCDKAEVNIGGIEFSSLFILTNVWSQKNNLLNIISLNDIDKFTLKYKGVEIFKVEEYVLNKLKYLRNKIYSGNLNA